MSKITVLYFIVTILIASIVDDLIHIYYGHLIGSVETYNSFVTTLSFLTKPLQVLGAAIVYYLIGDYLYSNSRLIKAVILTILICLIKDGLIRQPFMNILLGNSIFDSLCRESQVWLSTLGMSLVLTFMIIPKKQN